MTTGAETHDAETARHPIAIRIDNVVYEVQDRHQTGASLKALAGVPADYQLFLETPGAEPDRQIRDSEAIEVHAGEKFYAVPAGTVG